MRKFVAFAMAGALASVASAAQFQNGSFETGSFVDNTGAKTDSLAQGSTAMTGWTVIGGGDVAWEGPGNPYTITPSDGSYNLDLTGYTDHPPFGGVSQVFDTVVGHTYSLSFDVGNSGRYNGGGATVNAMVGALGVAGLPSNSYAVLQDYSFTNSGLDPNDPDHSFWATGSTQFTALTGSTQLNLVGTQGGAFIGLDNVKLADVTVIVAPSPTPEPASWAMMLGGFGLVGATMRRRSTVRFA